LGHEKLSTTHIYLQGVSGGAKEAMEPLGINLKNIHNNEIVPKVAPKENKKE